MNPSTKLEEPNLWNSFVNEVQPARLIPTFFSTGLIWLICIIIAMSYSALLFKGRLASYYGMGMGMVLMSSMIISVLVAVFSSHPGTIAFPQDTTAVLMAGMVGNIIAVAPVDMPDQVLFITVIVSIGLTSLITGLFFLILGMLRAGNLIRYIPFPVVGGFLAGTGWLLFQGGLSVMTGSSLDPDTISYLLQNDVLVKWLPGLIFAVVVLGLLRRYGNIVLLPISMIVALMLFYFVLYLTGATVVSAREQGWFLETFSDSAVWQPLSLDAILQVDGRYLLDQTANVVVIIMVSTLHFLLNASGQELVIKKELDLNDELRITGGGNALIGLLGGMVGFHALSLTALAHKFGGLSRLGGILLALLFAGTMFYGASAMALFPKVILGGLLMFLGLGFLVEWLFDTYSRLPLSDYLIILLIVLVIATIGFLEGAVVGLGATIVLFVLEYSRIGIIRNEFSGALLRSNIERSAEVNMLLQELGKYIWVIKLEGFIFFGTSHQFLQHVRERIHDIEKEALAFVILDFRMVRSIDTSAVVDFVKLRELAHTHGFHIIFTDLSPSLSKTLIYSGYGSLETEVSRVFPDIDHGMEWCEDFLLNKANTRSISAVTLQEDFDTRTMTRMLDVGTLARYLERIDAKVGDYLIHQGEEPDSLYFIESGRVSIELETEHGNHIRLRSMSAGTIVGEIGFYMGHTRTASVIVEAEGVMYKLTRTALKRMESDDSESASSFHVYIACVVSERLTSTNRLVQALLE